MDDSQIEAAARRLCELKGLDPDFKLPSGWTEWWNWRGAVEIEMQRQQVEQAIRETEDSEGGKG